MKKKFALFLLSIFLLSSCSTTTNTNSMPNWFINQYDSSYTKNNYVVAVGSGETKEKAEENAKISLSQIFNTSIKNAIVTYDNNNSSSLNTRGYIDTTVDDLIGVNLVNTYVNNDGVFFVRVALDKRIAINKTKEIITPKNNEINSLLNKGNIDDFKYLKNLLKAQKIAISISKYYDQLSVLEGSFITSPSMKIEEKIADLKNSLTIDIIVNSDSKETSNKLKKVVQTMLLDSGVSIDESSAKLIIDYQDSMSDEKDGLYQCSFNLKLQLINNDSIVFSINKDSRGIGINEDSAKNKAMEKASKIVEGELF